MQAQTNQDGRDDVNISSDEVIYSGDQQDGYNKMTLQEKVGYCFEEIQELLNDKRFITHIKPHASDMDVEETMLHRHMVDLKRTDFSIIFAGETSSGKSSIINEVLNAEILPTGICATTTRICRIKHSEEMVILTRDERDERDITQTKLTSTEEMADKLETLAKTDDPRIGYVDICMPFPFEQGNVVIVDTPGIGDTDQNEVANKMMAYLPNALAFVFVINVAATGGVQKDRFILILDHVKNSLKEMVSFDPYDVIFLLNKWDTFLKADRKEKFFKDTKKELCTIWENVKPTRILKFSMNKEFGEFEAMYQCFQEQLEEVIKKNKMKRLEVHLKFLKKFLNVCKNAVSPELQEAKKKASASKITLTQDMDNIAELKKVLQEESSNPADYIERFIDEVAQQFHIYVNGQTFQRTVIANVQNSWRPSIGFDIDAEIEDKTKIWQETNVPRIFNRVVLRRLISKLGSINETFNKDLMKGFQTPFDIDKKFFKSALLSATYIAGGVAFRLLSYDPKIAFAMAATGFVFTSLMNFGYINDFETVSKEALRVRIATLTEQNIRNAFHDSFAENASSNLKNALEKLKTEIERLEDDKKALQTEHDDNIKMLDIFTAFDTKLSEVRTRLKDMV